MIMMPIKRELFIIFVVCLNEKKTIKLARVYLREQI